jgi:hypothetical protein
MGGIDIDFAKTASNKGYHNQCTSNEDRHGVHIAQEKDVLGKEQGLADSINPGSEHNAQANNEKFDSPFHRADSRPKGPFQVHQNEHCGDELHHAHYFGRCMRTDPPISIWLDVRRNRHQLVSENQGHTHWD